jgi:hypothetical protein
MGVLPGEVGEAPQRATLAASATANRAPSHREVDLAGAKLRVISVHGG